MKHLTLLLLLLPLTFFGQGKKDSLGIYRFDSYSNLITDIDKYFSNKGAMGTFVIAYDLRKKNCTKVIPYITLSLDRYQFEFLDINHVKEKFLSEAEFKKIKPIKVNKKLLNELNQLSYNDFITQYVNVETGVLKDIGSGEKSFAVLYKLLSYNISVYINEYSGDYIVPIQEPVEK